MRGEIGDACEGEDAAGSGVCREVLAVFVLVVDVVLDSCGDAGEVSGRVCRAARVEGVFEDDGFVVFPDAVGVVLEVIVRFEVVEEGCGEGGGEGDVEVMGRGGSGGEGVCEEGECE